MRTLEDVFVREFRTSVSAGYKDIYNIPLPEVSKSWEVSGTEVYAIKGIEDEYYGKLNKSMVKKLPKGFEAKRRVIDKVNRTYKKDEKGNYIYSDYKVPSGSLVITSEINIELPYSRYIKDMEGYGYIDFINKDGKVLYMYAIPKEVLYKVNQTALAISVKNMKNYNGMGLVSWNNGTIYIHVIPYSPNSQYIGSKILKTGFSLNYKSEVDALVEFWQAQNLIPDIKLCGLQTNENLCIKPTVVGYDSYLPVERLPLSSKEIYGAEEEE